MNENSIVAPKPLVASKTVIVNAIVALAAFYPPIGEWVSANPSLSLQILAGINFALRLVTKGKVVLFNS